MSKKEIVKVGFIYYVLSTLVVSIQFLFYLLNSPQLEYMDFSGMFFFVTAAISQAALFTLIPFLLVFLPVALITGKDKLSYALFLIFIALEEILLYINGFVFSLYKFHINGFVLSLYFGEGGDEIFTFDFMVYLKITAAVVFVVVGNVLLVMVARKIYKQFNKIYFVPCLSVMIFFLLFSNLFHAYAAVVQKQSVIKSSSHIPYYFPLTANRLMIKLGVITPDDLVTADFGKNGNVGLKYPLKKLDVDSVSRKNIVVIVIDSWNYNSMNPEAMPNVYSFSSKNAVYENHLSSSNGTRGSIFGLFFGTSSYYWTDFDVSGVTPLLVDELQKENYAIKTFPSATLQNPNFAKLLFYKVPGINANTNGATTFDRDCQLTKDFVSFVDTSKVGDKPFFAFLFYDLAHSFECPKDRARKFIPSWDFADYMKLNNDMDPTPFWNLYLNCVNAVDSLAGVVLNKLEEKGLLDNTIVVITGDHGQEFNENHKNYWGHGSNYTYPQIHVPFIVHRPGGKAERHTYRTTHYDVSPTLMREALGVKGDPQDYSMGRLLTDSTFRNWHVVGDNLNFAFIVEDNVIIEKKPSGSLEIYDAHLNPLDNYKVKSKDLNQAILNLNKFYK
ncbi:MAG TPA: sulfatase-like hydrolase/transferase [Paludibacteraceae bacterium]|nr:sulfatase-like hydrolase/transferase [Paludibacteraceae bacterium]HQF49184.1 sulfatase-like hydrolase/transferase [Paludibacteraceae bacterium]